MLYEEEYKRYFKEQIYKDIRKWCVATAKKINKEKDTKFINRFYDYMINQKYYGDNYPEEWELFDFYYNEKFLPWLNNLYEKYKKKYTKLQEKELDELVEKTELTLKYDSNCPLCVIDNKTVNAGIFFYNWDVNSVNNYFSWINSNVRVDGDIVNKHKKHIIAMPISLKEKMNKVKQTLKDMSKIAKLDINNDDVLQARINLITTIINEMEKNNLTWSEQYVELNNLLIRYIDIMNKIKNGEKIVVKKDLNDILVKILDDK